MVKNKETVEYSVPITKIDMPINNQRVVTDKLDIETKSDYACTQLLSEYLKETTLLINCRLIAQDDSNDNQEIMIRENPFIIGSYSAKCNYSLSNKLISRMHIRITKENSSQAYFAEDLNSTNGTFINGEKIEPNQRVQIKDGDIIKMAVLQYKFKVD